MGFILIIGAIASAVQAGVTAFSQGTPKPVDTSRPAPATGIDGILNMVKKYWYIPLALFILFNKKLRRQLGL